MTRKRINPALHALPAALAVAIASQAGAQPAPQKVQRATALEEVIVTAQKRTESLQNAPISIAALSEQQLQVQGISSLADLGGGTIPSLRVQPFVNSPSTLTIGMRGNAPSDPGQITREPSVGIYLDDVYLSRAQGLGMEVADLQRIEVLRGPQGTLFGRNTTGGAVRLITKKPTGQFGLSQTLDYGNYAYYKSVTHLNLPEVAGVATKFDYFHSQQDGWVKNNTPHADDYNASNADSARFALKWNPTDSLQVDYAFDWSYIEATQNYFQFYNDKLGFFGSEINRQDKVRFPYIPLDPTKTEQYGNNLTLTWNINPYLTIKSITGYRSLDEKTRNNYAGALYYNGLITHAHDGQNQFSEELQFLGETGKDTLIPGNLKYLVGLYYYKEKAEEYLVNLATFDIFGTEGYGFMTPIVPPQPETADVPRSVNSRARSRAIYMQFTWTPPILGDRLDITLGGRYTMDRKEGFRYYPLPALIVTGKDSDPFALETSNFDPTVTFAYQWTDALNTYIRWAQGYKAAGVNMRSFSFRPYGEEKVQNLEFGLKSEFWDRRARLNLAVFDTVYKGYQIDFQDPARATFSETIGAEKDVDVRGVEADFTVIPLEGLTLGMNVTYYWDAYMPFQPNPLNGGIKENFDLSQTPDWAYSATADYEFAPFSFGTLSLHLDMSSTDGYSYAPKAFDRHDGYTLYNGRISLADIPLGSNHGNLRVSLWGKNLTDEEYVVYAFNVATVSVPQAFGQPRTYGVEVNYTY